MLNFNRLLLFTLLPLLFFLERFAFYAFRLLLLLYWNSPEGKNLGFTPALALLVHGTYFSVLHFLPLVGGYLADRVLGIKNALLVGLFSLVLGYSTFWFFLSEYTFFPLFLIAIGYSLCKPTLGALIGVIYPRRSNEQENLFAWLYITLNLSIVAAALIGGYFQLTHIPKEMFFIAQGAILSAFLLFVIMLPQLLPYFREHEKRRQKELDSLANISEIKEYWFLPKEKEKFNSLLRIFLFALFFSAAHHQGGSLLLLYMGDRVDLHFFHYEIPTLWMTALGGMMTALATALLSRLWGVLSARGTVISVRNKLIFGLFSLTVAFGLLAIINQLNGNKSLVPFAWILLFEVIFVVANGIVNPLLWSITSAAAPERYRSIYIGFLIGATSIGGIVGSFLDYFLPQLGYEGIWSITALLTCVVLFLGRGKSGLFPTTND